MQLVACVARLAVQAAASVSLQQHKATHPRLGAIDHIACQYLPSEGRAAEQAAVAVARGIAAAVANELPTLPVVLYGAACGGQRLQDVRRACGAQPHCPPHFRRIFDVLLVWGLCCGWWLQPHFKYR